MVVRKQNLGKPTAVTRTRHEQDLSKEIEREEIYFSLSAGIAASWQNLGFTDDKNKHKFQNNTKKVGEINMRAECMSRGENTGNKSDDG